MQAAGLILSNTLFPKKCSKIDLSKQQIPQESCLACTTVCPYPMQLYSQGAAVAICLLCLKLIVAFLSAQPSYLTCTHVLFIKKVSIDIPDKKQAYK